MIKICPECGYDKNQETARRCGNCAYNFEGQSISLTSQSSSSLDLQESNMGADMVRMFEAMYRTAEEFEKHNLSWHVGGKHVKAYELKKKIRKLQSGLEDEALGAYKSLAVAQIRENVDIQKLVHETNVEKARVRHEIDVERERLAVTMTLIVDALQLLEETVTTHLVHLDEHTKRDFIEDYFKRIMNKYVSGIDADDNDLKRNKRNKS